MKTKYHKQGFTLSETLITISIIGMVSILTLPNLINNYQNKSYVAQLQRFYKSLSYAANQCMVDERTDNLEETILGKDDGAKKFLKKYFVIVKTCESVDECFADTYRSLDSSVSESPGLESDTDSYCVALNTGARVCMSQMHVDENSEKHGTSFVLLDLNGTKKPNIAGRDFFGFYLYSDGKIADYYVTQTKETYDIRCSNNSGIVYGGHCLEKIISDGWKMDY